MCRKSLFIWLVEPHPKLYIYIEYLIVCVSSTLWWLQSNLERVCKKWIQWKWFNLFCTNEILIGMMYLGLPYVDVSCENLSYGISSLK